MIRFFISSAAALENVKPNNLFGSFTHPFEIKYSILLLITYVLPYPGGAVTKRDESTG